MTDGRGALERRLAKARLFVHTMRDLGLPTVGHVVVNSARRRRAQLAELQRGPSDEPWTPPGERRAVTAVAHGARVEFADAAVDIAFLAEDVVRLAWEPGPVPVPYAVVDALPWWPPRVEVVQEKARVVLRGGALDVEVAHDGAITVGRSGGPVLRALAPPARRGAAWRQGFAARPGERLSGLGEQAAGVDLRGHTLRLWNRDPGGSWGPGRRPLYMGIPVLLGAHPDGGLLTFVENSTDATVELPAHEEEAGTWTFAGGALRQYLVAADPAMALERLSALTGRPALPPRWALGYHQSRWGYKSEADVAEVLDGYRAMDVPLSAVHLDIDYMRGYRVFTVDEERFPDLAGLSRRAEEQAVRVVTIIDPGVKVDHRYDVYRQGVEGGRFCTRPDGSVEVGVVWPGRAVFPDFTDAGARDWWSALYRRLTDAGVAGVWHDMNEPTSISLAGDPTLPCATVHSFDGRGGDHAEAHNLYGMLMNRAGAEGLRRARPDRRPWIVSRSGWAGMQRDAWNWTGDVESSWAGLRQQIATVLGVGLSGVPYSGPDIGGFSGVPDGELYLRWLQMAVLLPFCRTHSIVGAPPREPWRFEEPVRSMVAAWIRFRYRLLPYLYSLAHQAAASGAPLVRPLWWPAPDGPVGGALDADDAFLLGDDVLVAPVTEPGAADRDVPRPPGPWCSWWAPDGPAGAGSRLAAPLGRIPVLVRGGSVLVLDDSWADHDGPCALDGDGDVPRVDAPRLAPDHSPGLFAVHCWPHAGAAQGFAADDAGEGDGPVRRDEFVLDGAAPGATAVLRWRRTGDFPPPDALKVVLHGLRAERAEADGVPVEVVSGTVSCRPFEELRLSGLREPEGRVNRPGG